MRSRALLLVPLLLLLTGCAPLTAGETLSAAVSALPGVQNARALSGQGDAAGIAVTMTTTATTEQADAVVRAWAKAAPDTASTLTLTVGTRVGSLTATSPVDDRLDGVVADWWTLSALGRSAVTADYGAVRYEVYPAEGATATGPAALAALADRVRAAVPHPHADTVALRAAAVSVTSTDGDYDSAVLRALQPAFAAAGAAATLDLTVSSVPVVQFTADSTVAFEKLLDALPFSTGAVVQLSDESGIVATLRAGQCVHSGDTALWAYWGGPKACG